MALKVWLCSESHADTSKNEFCLVTLDSDGRLIPGLAGDYALSDGNMKHTSSLSFDWEGKHSPFAESGMHGTCEGRWAMTQEVYLSCQLYTIACMLTMHSTYMLPTMEIKGLSQIN